MGDNEPVSVYEISSSNAQGVETTDGNNLDDCDIESAPSVLSRENVVEHQSQCGSNDCPDDENFIYKSQIKDNEHAETSLTYEHPELKCENTAQSSKSTHSETSEAVKALEECYSNLNELLADDVEPDLKETTFSTESSLDVPPPVISNSSEGSTVQSNQMTNVSNCTISPSQVMDFDENAQYKVAESTQLQELSLQPEFEGIKFSENVNIYHADFDEDSAKSSEDINVRDVFSNAVLATDNDMNVDSNDELIKINDERSVSSSVAPVDEDRSEISDNSLMTFPDKIVAPNSLNGDASIDADIINKDSTIKSEDSNDVMITCASTPEPNVESSFNIETPQPIDATVLQATPSTSTTGFTFPAENLFEYQWPQETDAEWYLLQEQICEFLHVKSFKRKYPELNRRIPGQEEKEFLKMRGVISETQCDLGLTALRADEVHDLMMCDYPRKYQEYAKVLHEKEKQNFKDKLKSYSAPKLDKAKFAVYLKKAIKSAADFNSQFQRERREERRAYFDLQTMAIHYPKSKRRVLPPELTKPSPYPVSLMPGQFQDYYKEYSADELKYLPLNTALFGPPKTFSLQQTIEITANAALADDSANSNDEGSLIGGCDDEDVAPVVQHQKDTPVKTADKANSGDMRCRVCEAKDEVGNVKKATNKSDKSPEELVQCSECHAYGHPSCLDLTQEMVVIIKTYPWQCMDCKTCVECTDPFDEDKMMFCDRCDRGYHTFCVGLRGLPIGRWECRSCCMEPPRRKKLRRERRDRRRNGIKSESETVS